MQFKNEAASTIELIDVLDLYLVCVFTKWPLGLLLIAGNISNILNPFVDCCH